MVTINIIDNDRFVYTIRMIFVLKKKILHRVYKKELAKYIDESIVPS